MVPLIQLIILPIFYWPITSHVHGNSLSLLTTHSNHSLFSCCPKTHTSRPAASTASGKTIPFLLGFYGRHFIQSSGDSYEWSENGNTESTLSARKRKSLSDLTGSSGQLLESAKNRVRRGLQDTAGKEKDTVQEAINSALGIKEKDLSIVGSGNGLISEEIAFFGSTTVAVTPLDKGHAQYRPEVQTAYSVHTNPTTNSLPQTSLSATASPEEKTELTSKWTSQLDPNRTRLEIGRWRTTTSQSHKEATSHSTSPTNLQLEAASSGMDVIRSNYSTKRSNSPSTKSMKIPNDQDSETQRTETDIKSTKGPPVTFPRTTTPSQIGRGHFAFSENGEKFAEKDQSVSQRIVPSLNQDPAFATHFPPKDPCATGVGRCVLSKDKSNDNNYGATNGSFLVWADLKQTLSFAWELHVFGSAALFLLLTAGSVLGLALAPSLKCPHFSELILTNSFLLVVGAVRAGHFLIDPYGTRLLLPPPVIIALYTLPLPLLILAEAALVILVLKEAGVPWLPPTLPRPPLIGILAVLQCTLLLAADLLSPALSPAVPIVLQSLTLTAGLVLCLSYLFLALPRISHTLATRGVNKGTGERKVQVLARILAVCALLGSLCCLLHIYSCLWLYGLLGDWRQFRWAWWLCQFWVRLLELAWSFCLLLLSSWVFWRPSNGQICGTARQEVAATESLPSTSQPSNSTSRHTCWAKIVQSLKVRQLKKSESNGISGSNSGGELPNNWAGQERSGADISKSLIRNRDPLKDSNLKSFAVGSEGSLLKLQALAQPSHCSLSSSLDRDKESAISLFDFDLRPPTPIDLSRSIDKALHREHLLRGESLFQSLQPSPPPSPDLWMRRNSDPQITISMSSDEHTFLTESSAGLDRSIPSAVPSRQVTAPPTPTHQGFRWVSEAPVPSSLSCPVSLNPSPSTSHALIPSAENTRPFITPDLEHSQSYSRARQSGMKTTRNDDSASVSSGIIDL